MEILRLHCAFAQVVGNGFDHRRGAAQIDVDFAIEQVSRFDVLGDVAAAAGVGDGG